MTPGTPGKSAITLRRHFDCMVNECFTFDEIETMPKNVEQNGKKCWSIEKMQSESRTIM